MRQMEIMNNDYILCYVKDGKAFFTTKPLAGKERQWGDDWNDEPYEHNAEEPYKWHGQAGEGWGVEFCYFVGAYEEPQDFNAGVISVERINKGAVPWIIVERWANKSFPGVFAGTNFPEFVQFIHKTGGNVFTRMPFLHLPREASNG